jgi:hypothetical protein
MKAQTPAEGILKTNDWGDSRAYHVVCECGSSDCSHNLWVEADDSGIAIIVYTTVKTNFWSKSRWAHIWTLLTKGYVDFEGSIHLKEQTALNYAETLKLAIKDVKDFKKP